MSANEFDVLIIGGGMVGASLGCALGELPLRVGLIEAIPFGAAGQPSYDDRTTGLSLGTRRIYESLGLWQEIAPAAEPIKRIHISEKGRFGVTRLDARDHGEEALGYIVVNRVLGRVLNDRMRQLPRLQQLCPAKFAALETRPDATIATVETDAGREQLRARLVVGADGADSRVRAALGLGAEVSEYHQTAIVTNVTPERDHAGTAYERFTPDGPVALLPMSQGRCGLVWMLRDTRAAEVMNLADAAFLSTLQDAFGHRLGIFRQVGRKSAYPLRRVLSKPSHAPRALLIGNAAHTLHPVAAQGFNLGLRDVAMLAEVLGTAVEAGEDVGADTVLQRYLAGRAEDQSHVSGFTDSLVRLFSNRIAGLAQLRHLGLLGLDLLPPVKARLARRSMGMVGAPRLSRGLGLGEKH